MSFKKIDFVSSVSNKLITNIMFSVCGTFAMLKLYILIICTGPLYVWIIITAISELTGCHNYKAKPIFFTDQKIYICSCFWVI